MNYIYNDSHTCGTFGSKRFWDYNPIVAQVLRMRMRHQNFAGLYRPERAKEGWAQLLERVSQVYEVKALCSVGLCVAKKG